MDFVNCSKFIVFRGDSWIIQICMNHYLKTVFIAACCLCICPPHFVYASNTQSNGVNNYIAATAYRRAYQLCYTATYYGSVHPGFINRIVEESTASPMLDRLEGNLRSAEHPIYSDSEYRAGMIEWYFIDRNSFKSAFLDLGFEGGGGREGVFSYTSHVNTLVDSIGFEEAIEDCAREKNLDSEDLLEDMRSLILRVDNHANWLGRTLSFAGLLLATDLLLIRPAIMGFRAVRPFVSNSGVVTWLSQTRVVEALRSRVAFLQRHKKPVILGTGGTVLISTTQAGHSDPYLQIYQENVMQISDDDAQNMADNIGQDFLNNDNFEQLWTDRVQKSRYEAFEGQYREIVRIAERLRNLEGSNGESSPLYQELYRRLHIRIDLYFVDYWIVYAVLNFLRDSREDLSLLNAIKEMFAFRKMQLEDQAEIEMTTQSAVALELLDLSQNDDSFTLCDFNGVANSVTHRSRSNLLCRAHFLYTLRQYNGVHFSEEQTVELDQLETELFP